jgi:predicted transposase YdaD
LLFAAAPSKKLESDTHNVMAHPQGKRMPAFDSGFKIAARASGRRLADIAISRVDDWLPIVSEVQTTERFADRAFRARRDQEWFVVYMEAYTQWRKEAPWNLLAKSSLLSERERLPTICLVYILRSRGYKPQNGKFELKVHDETSQFLRMHEICMWELQPQSWWKEAPGLMTLYPLCRHGQQPKDAIAYAAGAITAATQDTNTRADLLTTLAIFGKMAYEQIDVMGLIGREQMKESAILAEFTEEARIETAQAYVLAVLEERFGREAVASCRDAIRGVTNENKLRRLNRLAVRCANIEAFQRGLRGR